MENCALCYNFDSLGNITILLDVGEFLDKSDKFYFDDQPARKRILRGNAINWRQSMIRRFYRC